jgi:hypothetical protein
VVILALEEQEVILASQVKGAPEARAVPGEQEVMVELADFEIVFFPLQPSPVLLFVQMHKM